MQAARPLHYARGTDKRDRGREVAQQVKATEAARLLRVSRRTMERRIKDGTLSVTLEGRRRLVALPDDASTMPEPYTGTARAQLAQALA
jgi:excisionase family DNA binding protein